MKKIYLFAMMAMTASQIQAQDVPAILDTYDAAALATEDLNGTARYVGMGGAMDALGADLSTMGSNPAGIGLYRRGQASASMSVVMQQDGKSFQNGSKTHVSFDQAGAVFSTRYGKNGYLNFGFNYRKNRNFNYVLSAVNALNGSAQHQQTVLKDMNGLFLSKTPLPYSLLDDLYECNMVVGEDDNLYDYAGIDYRFDRAHTGYISEYDFNISGNINNRLYLGLTIGVHDVNYKSYSEYYEQLSSTDFPDVRITNNHKISGYGYNVKAGIIFRPLAESPFRIGAAVSTPTFYKLTTDNYTTFNGSVDYRNISEDFRFNTPWKFSVSAGHTIGNNLAIGAVYEYADYGTCDMRTIDGYSYDYWTDTYDEDSSTDPVMKHHTESTLKGVSTLKLGAEFKPDKNIALRVGYNYVSPIYQEKGVRDQTLPSSGVFYATTTDYTNWKDTHRFTAGIGFSFDQFRLDLAYQYSTRKGDFYPFMENYSAAYIDDVTGETVTLTNSCKPVSVKDNRHQIMASMTYTF